MKKMPWVKLAGGLLRDEKIHFIIKKYGHDTMVVWTGLLTECERGVLEMDEEIFAEVCIMDMQRFEEIKKIFLKFGLVTQCNGEKLKISNWEKYQFSDSYERVKAHREKKSSVNVTERNELVTDEKQKVTLEGEEEGDVEEEKETGAASAPGRSKAASPSCPHEEIIAAYHETLPTCPRVREWTETRQSLLRSRWRDDPKRQTLEWWRKFFAYVSESDFLCGRTEPRKGSPPFLCDLEWLIRPSNFVKVIEGKYHNAQQ